MSQLVNQNKTKQNKQTNKKTNKQTKNEEAWERGWYVDLVQAMKRGSWECSDLFLWLCCVKNKGEVFRGCGFTSKGQDHSVQLCAEYWQVQKIKEAASLKVKGLLYGRLLIARLPSGSRTLN